jgi:GNAT superfamily N-acetyltransferase
VTACRYRQRHAGDYFLGAYEVEPSSDGSSRRLLIGYTCATLTRQPTLTHDAMSTHEPEGTHVAIHSVCVAPSHRQRGIATALLREYLARLDQAGQQQQQQSARSRIESALLIAHPELVPLYERAGFTVVGPSAVVHGAKPWVELKRDLLSKPVASSSSSAAASSSSSSAGPSTTTPQATEAPPAQEEEEEEGEVRSPGRLLGYFKGGMADLVDPKDGTNKVNLYCPRAECRCLLLRAGAGTWVQGTTKHDIEVRLRANSRLFSLVPGICPLTAEKLT